MCRSIPSEWFGIRQCRGSRGGPAFTLFSVDVIQAFAAGLTFDEFGALRGQDVMKVEFDVPIVDIGCLRKLSDFKCHDPIKEAFVMLKPMYGLIGVAPSMA